MSRVATRAKLTASRAGVVAAESWRLSGEDTWVRAGAKRRATRGLLTKRSSLREEEAGLARRARARSPGKGRGWVSWTWRRRRAGRWPLRFRKRREGHRFLLAATSGT